MVVVVVAGWAAAPCCCFRRCQPHRATAAAPTTNAAPPLKLLPATAATSAGGVVAVGGGVAVGWGAGGGAVELVDGSSAGSRYLRGSIGAAATARARPRHSRIVEFTERKKVRLEVYTKPGQAGGAVAETYLWSLSPAKM